MTNIRLRASTLADLVALPPYVLGFEPQESVVIVQLTDGLLAWAARCDNDQVVDADRARGLWQQLPVASGSGLLLVCYSRDLARARRVLRRVTNAASQSPMLSACVFGEEYEIVESNLPQLTRGATRLKETALAASAVYEGLNVLPSRSTLEAQVAGPTGEELPEPLVAAISDLLTWPASRKELWLEQALSKLRDGQQLDEADNWVLLTLVNLPPVLAHCWVAADIETAVVMHDVWLQMVQIAPTDLAPAPLILLAQTSWLRGAGVLLNVCLERAATLPTPEPYFSFLLRAAREPIPAAAWETLRPTLPRAG